MLSSIGKSRHLTVKVNGRPMEGIKGETIMELCHRNHIMIPHLCHHPNLPPRASCRVCLVECDGKWLSPACVTPIWDGLSISTNSKRVHESVKTNLEMLLATHDERCTSCIANNHCAFRDLEYAFGVDHRDRETPAPKQVDNSSNAISFDVSKCVLCGRCIRACEYITGTNSIEFANRNDKLRVQPADGLKFNQTNCTTCGVCTLYCPVGALTEKNQAREVFDDIRKHADKIMVAIIDPSTKIGLSDGVGLPAGTDSTGKIITLLKNLGFDLVFDGAVGDDIMIREEANKLIKHLSSNSKMPLFSSNCPAFVNYVEQSRPDLIKYLSDCRSPQAMMSALVKTILSRNWVGLSLRPDDFYCLTISSCLSRKDEIERPDLVTSQGVKETDAAISTRELAQIIKLNHTDFNLLKSSKFDSLSGEGTGYAALLSTPGGLTETVLKCAYQKVTGKELKNIEFKDLIGMQNVKVAEVDFNGQRVQAAYTDGTRFATYLIKRIQDGDPLVKDIKYVEVLACPGGCVNGGGSPQFFSPRVMQERIKALKLIDQKAKDHKIAESPIISQFIKEELSDTKLTHRLLHRQLKARPK